MSRRQGARRHRERGGGHGPARLRLAVRLGGSCIISSSMSIVSISVVSIIITMITVISMIVLLLVSLLSSLGQGLGAEARGPGAADDGDRQVPAG